MSKNIHLPIPAIGALRKLGDDLNRARRRRRITKALMAERAGIAINTLTRIEKGEGQVSMAAYASVLFVLGLEGSLRDIADASKDIRGLELMEEELPKRVRYPKARN